MKQEERIAELRVGSGAEGYYILKSAALKTSAAGKPFLSAVLADVSGEIDAKAWDYSGPINTNNEGSVVKARGTVSEFKGKPQFTITQLRLATEADRLDKTGLVPMAPLDPKAAMMEIWELVDAIQDGEYRAICQTLLRRHEAALMEIPAAKSVHHSFLGGLLMHTLYMLKAADFLSGLYADVVDRSLLLAGTLLHDLAKEREFCFSQLGLVTGYSVKGQLLGHLVMGAQEAAAVAAELGVPEQKSVLLQHLILSHHGEPEYGAAVKPSCAESELLFQLDMLDSRMEIYRETLAQLPVGEFSGQIFALGKRVYRHR